MTIFGDGTQTRDFVYVEDVARSNLLALQTDYCGELNIERIGYEIKRFDNYIKAANVVLDTVYGRTQEILRNMGYSPNSYLYLYRGIYVSMYTTGLKAGKVLNLRKFKHNPLSSWSFDPSTALGFGSKVLVTKVKVKDIVSIYMTGLGCSEESEVLIPAHVAAVAKVVAS